MKVKRPSGERKGFFFHSSKKFREPKIILEGENLLKNLDRTWDLETIFPGGSESEEFKKYVEDLGEEISGLNHEIKGEIGDWEDLIDRVQKTGGKLREASSFVGCLNAQDVKDEKAKLWGRRMQQMGAALQSVLTTMDKKMLQIPEEEWDEILQKRPDLAYNLEERRQRAAELMPEDMEKLATDLSVDGYHGWSDLYNVITGRMTIPFTIKGKERKLSIGQAANVFANPDPQVRKEMGEKWEKAWEEESELCANALNHLGGFRLNLYRHRGWDSVLKEPLEINRMAPQTLDVMWETIDDNKEVFVRFLDRKARMLGMDKLGWCDLRAPVGESSGEYSFDEGANFVVGQFEQVSPRMAQFARAAFKNGWIEAEDRGGKRQGAFCTSFPMSEQTRVFMTFSGTAGNVSTLAHELGHAFHQYAMKGLPLLAQRYAMNVAETASTFAEMVVADAALRNARDEEEKIALLGDKVGKSISFFMDIHCRFLFEKEFYEARQKGPVGTDQLNQMMENAQKNAFRESLRDYHPHFWASKLHFYITAVPFYNFPYTFGYLFSAGVYALAKQKGEEFEQKYIELLRDTGRMQVEDLARKHLEVDLTQGDFWQNAVNLAVGDAEEFLKLTENR